MEARLVVSAAMMTRSYIVVVEERECEQHYLVLVALGFD
jgi:hypothetical protein